MRWMKICIEVLQLASPLNFESPQVYIFEKTASLPVTDNRSLEKACNTTVKNFVCSQDRVHVSCVCWCHAAVLAVSGYRLVGEPSFYWYQVTVLTDVTLHSVCRHVYALLAFYVLIYLLMPHTNTVLAKPLAACTYLSSIASALPYTMLKSIRKSKNRYFYHIFVSPGDARGAITLNVVWMEREFDACQTPRSMYPSIFNSFPVIRTASAKKIAVYTYPPYILFPWRRPCDYHALCCMDGKTIHCLPNPSQHVPIYLQ